MNIAHWLKHTVTRKQRTGIGTKGDPTFGAATTFKAKVDKMSKTIRRSNGSTLKISHVLTTTTAISVDDQFWFPSIAGEPADDTTSADAARAPAEVNVSASPSGYAIFTAFF